MKKIVLLAISVLIINILISPLGVTKSYRGNYKWGNQRLEFNQIIKVDKDYLAVGRERNNQGIIMRLNYKLEQIKTTSVDFPIRDIIQLGVDQFVLIGSNVVAKVDKQGQEQWRKEYDAKINALVKINSNKFLIAGSKAKQAWLAKLNSTGQEINHYWFNAVGQGTIYDLAKTANGDVLAAGEITSNKDWQVESRAWLMRLNQTGVKKWSFEKDRGLAWGDRFLKVIETTKEEIIVVGDDGYVVKLNQSGQEIWAKTLTGFTAKYNDIIETEDGKFMLLGQQSIGRSYGGGADDYPYSLLINESGIKLKEKRFTTALEGRFKAVTKITNDQYLAVGSGFGQSVLHNTKALLLRLEPNLNSDLIVEKELDSNLNTKFITQQPERTRVAIDLLALEEMLAGVKLKKWDAYYQFSNTTPVDAAWGDKGVPVILIHGFQTKAVSQLDYEQAIKLAFGQLAKKLVQDKRLSPNEIRIYGCTWPTKVNSLADNAKLLKQAIATTDDLRYRDDIIIIAHSMGGLLARAYIEEYGGAAKVQKLITITTPHQGVPPSLVYNWTRSKLLQSTVAFFADNGADIDFPGLRDTFATRKFYQMTDFNKENLELEIADNPFLSKSNQNFAHYYNLGKYQLIGASIAEDENVKSIFKLIDDSYNGLRNDGLVATTSSLFSENYSGIVKTTSHAAITEDQDVITAIIDEVDNLVYHYNLDKSFLNLNKKLKIEIYKICGGNKFKIYEQIIDSEQVETWSTADLRERLTMQGQIKTTNLGLGGRNLIKIHAINGEKLREIASFLVNAP